MRTTLPPFVRAAILLDADTARFHGVKIEHSAPDRPFGSLIDVFVGGNHGPAVLLHVHRGDLARVLFATWAPKAATR